MLCYITVVADSFDSNFGTLNSQASLIPPRWVSLLSSVLIIFFNSESLNLLKLQLLRPWLTSKHQLVKLYLTSRYLPLDLCIGLELSLVSICILPLVKQNLPLPKCSDIFPSPPCGFSWIGGPGVCWPVSQTQAMCLALSNLALVLLW